MSVIKKSVVVESVKLGKQIALVTEESFKFSISLIRMILMIIIQMNCVFLNCL